MLVGKPILRKPFDEIKSAGEDSTTGEAPEKRLASLPTTACFVQVVAFD